MAKQSRTSDLTIRMIAALSTHAGHRAGLLVCDMRTGNALVRRGLADPSHRRDYRITPAGIVALEAAMAARSAR